MSSICEVRESPDITDLSAGLTKPEGIRMRTDGEYQVKLLAAATLALLLCGCAPQAVKSTQQVEPGAEAVKSMAEKAVQVCGRGNVKSVTTTDFECIH